MNANVRVLEQNEENTLPTGLTEVVLAQAEEHGAWRVSDIDRLFIIEETQRRTTWEYDAELMDNVRDELVIDTAWASNGAESEEE